MEEERDTGQLLSWKDHVLQRDSSRGPAWDDLLFAEEKELERERRQRDLQRVKISKEPPLGKGVSRICRVATTQDRHRRGPAPTTIGARPSTRKQQPVVGSLPVRGAVQESSLRKARRASLGSPVQPPIASFGPKATESPVATRKLQSPQREFPLRTPSFGEGMTAAIAAVTAAASNVAELSTGSVSSPSSSRSNSPLSFGNNSSPLSFGECTWRPVHPQAVVGTEANRPPLLRWSSLDEREFLSSARLAPTLPAGSEPLVPRRPPSKATDKFMRRAAPAPGELSQAPSTSTLRSSVTSSTSASCANWSAFPGMRRLSSRTSSDDTSGEGSGCACTCDGCSGQLQRPQQPESLQQPEPTHLALPDLRLMPTPAQERERLRRWTRAAANCGGGSHNDSVRSVATTQAPPASNGAPLFASAASSVARRGMTTQCSSEQVSARPRPAVGFSAGVSAGTAACSVLPSAGRRITRSTSPSASSRRLSPVAAERPPPPPPLPAPAALVSSTAQAEEEARRQSSPQDSEEALPVPACASFTPVTPASSSRPPVPTQEMKEMEGLLERSQSHMLAIFARYAAGSGEPHRLHWTSAAFVNFANDTPSLRAFGMAPLMRVFEEFAEQQVTSTGVRTPAAHDRLNYSGFLRCVATIAQLAPHLKRRAPGVERLRAFLLPLGVLSATDVGEAVQRRPVQHNPSRRS
eukprot:TRINITY_DN55044_c0_g1_i1.p1 TRINITY_DN55044_c0_g1~~TRINITY_DN55044_c0_g1_i1.p1  ORF type:complete len:703 (-),score=120.79 TRINITY_DN55044_c0_g1_i1:157-2238(-)